MSSLPRGNVGFQAREMHHCVTEREDDRKYRRYLMAMLSGRRDASQCNGQRRRHVMSSLPHGNAGVQARAMHHSVTDREDEMKCRRYRYITKNAGQNSRRDYASHIFVTVPVPHGKAGV